MPTQMEVVIVALVLFALMANALKIGATHIKLIIVC